MPEEYRAYGDAWMRLNLDTQVIDWTLEDILADVPDALRAVLDDIIRRDDGRNGIEMYVQIADVAGYFLVHTYGGIYVNCDMQPVRALPDPMPDVAWASLENDTEQDVVNAAIGAPGPRNVFWAWLLDALPSRYFANPTGEMTRTTGPGLLTDMARTHPEMIHIFPRNTFNPIHWSLVAPGGDASGFDYPPETIAVHHWGHKKDLRSNHVETATQWAVP